MAFGDGTQSLPATLRHSSNAAPDMSLGLFWKFREWIHSDCCVVWT